YASVLLLCGCSTKLVDPCQGIQVTCVALYVDSGPPIDALDVRITSDAGWQRSQSAGRDSYVHSPPIAVALVFGDALFPSASAQLTFDVIGEQSTMSIASGSATATVTKNAHTSVHVKLLSGEIPDLSSNLDGAEATDANADALNGDLT